MKFYPNLNRISGVMVSTFTSSAVDRGFISGVMVSTFTSSAVDRGFISGVMVSMFTSSAVDRGFISGVMVSTFTSSAVDRGFKHGRDKPKTIKLACVASLPCTQHYGDRENTGWLGISIMCPNGETCLSADCCFIELAL